VRNTGPLPMQWEAMTGGWNGFAISAEGKNCS